MKARDLAVAAAWARMLRQLDRVRWRARNMVSRLRGQPILPPGIRIGKNVHIGRDVLLDWSHGRHIRIDDDVTVVSGARILCHDAAVRRAVGLTRVAPVHVCRGAFVGADALILPGVTIGEYAVVGAGAVVSRDVPPGAVVAGCPARPIGTVGELCRKRLEAAVTGSVFPSRLYNTPPVPWERLHQLDLAAEKGEYWLASDEAYAAIQQRRRSDYGCPRAHA